MTNTYLKSSSIWKMKSVYDFAFIPPSICTRSFLFRVTGVSGRISQLSSAKKQKGIPWTGCQSFMGPRWTDTHSVWNCFCLYTKFKISVTWKDIIYSFSHHLAPSSLQVTHTPHKFTHIRTTFPSLWSTLSLTHVQMGWVIPQDGASCFDNSCEAQCLLQQNTNWLSSAKCQPSASLLHHPKEDQVAFTICDPLTQNRNNLSTAVMIPFVC